MVSAACKKAGLPRATYYRWLHEDQEFANKVNDAILIGVDSINDLAETQLSLAIKKGEPWAIRFWLTNRSQHYAQPSKLIREIHHKHTMIPQAEAANTPPVALVRFVGDECDECDKHSQLS